MYGLQLPTTSQISFTLFFLSYVYLSHKMLGMVVHCLLIVPERGRGRQENRVLGQPELYIEFQTNFNCIVRLRPK